MGYSASGGMKESCGRGEEDWSCGGGHHRCCRSISLGPGEEDRDMSAYSKANAKSETLGGAAVCN